MPGGLDDFDVNAASQNLANIGQPDYLPGVTGPVYGPPASLAAPVAAPVVDVPAGAVPAAPVVPAQAATTQGVVSGQMSQNSPTPGPDDVVPMTPDEPAQRQFEPLPPPPARPALTGDPQKDMEAGVQYQRELEDWHAKATEHQGILNNAIKGVQSKQADREAAAEREAATQREEETKRYNAERLQRQGAIDAATTEHGAAAKDLEGFRWNKPHTGAQIVALIAGGIGQAFMNMSRVQAHQAPDAQNEALNLINKKMEQDYQQKQDRLKAASDSLLQARYGFKDAAENHRAALNDLDAETSAKYKLAAKEAESQLRQFGVAQADIDKNVMVAGLYEKANAAEMQIHDREEAHQIAREHNKATEDLAAANLNVARGNLAVHRLSEADTHADRQAAIDARKEAAKDKDAQKKATADEKKEARAFRDPDTGELQGYAGTPKIAQSLSDKLVAAKAYSSNLRALADDIEKNGRVGSDLPIIGTEAGKNRNNLFSETIARGRRALELGVSNANMQLEHGAMGGPGAGLSRMASPKVLRRMADENDRIAMQRLRSGLEAATDEQKARSKSAIPAENEPTAAQKKTLERLQGMGFEVVQ